MQGRSVAMNDAEHEHHHKPETHSGCACSSKGAPVDKPAAASCCRAPASPPTAAENLLFASAKPVAKAL